MGYRMHYFEAQRALNLFDCHSLTGKIGRISTDVCFDAHSRMQTQFDISTRVVPMQRVQFDDQEM